MNTIKERHKARETKERWMREALREAERLLIAQNVLAERPYSHDGAAGSVHDLLSDYLLSILLVHLGWNIPKEIYSMFDGLTDFLVDAESVIGDGSR